MKNPGMCKILCSLLFAFIAPTGMAADCTDQMLGDYTVKPGRPTFLRLEKVNNELLISEKRENAWVRTERESRLLNEDDVLDIAKGNPALAKQLCVLGISGLGMFLKVPVGFKYATSSPTGKSYDANSSKTGYLLQVFQGFSAAAVELYKAPRRKFDRVTDCHDRAMLGGYSMQKTGSDTFFVGKTNEQLTVITTKEYDRTKGMGKGLDLIELDPKHLLRLLDGDEELANQSCGFTLPNIGILLMAPLWETVGNTSSPEKPDETTIKITDYRYRLFEHGSSKGIEIYNGLGLQLLNSTHGLPDHAQLK